MKRNIFVLFVLAISVLFMASCQKAMKIDKPEICFGNDGGTEIVKTTNYDSWWIYDIVSCNDNKYYQAENFQRVIADGISAEVVGNSVIVTVMPSKQSNVWKLSMAMMDAGIGITVKQN